MKDRIPDFINHFTSEEWSRVPLREQTEYRHVHIDRRCLKNRYGARCPTKIGEAKPVIENSALSPSGEISEIAEISGDSGEFGEFGFYGESGEISDSRRENCPQEVVEPGQSTCILERDES